MPAAIRQLFFRRIHHAMQITGDHADYRLVPRLGVAHTQKFQQLPDVKLLAVRVLAAKSAQGIQFVRFKIRRAGVQPVGMLLRPRTTDIVLA